MAQKRRGPVLLELVGDRKEPPARSIPRGPGSGEAEPPRPAPVTRIDAPPIARPTPAPVPSPLASASAPPSEAPTSGLRDWVSPGRTVRMPAGYLFFFVAILASLFALGWALGHRSAVAKARAERAVAAERELDAAATREPLFETQAAAPSPATTYPPRQAAPQQPSSGRPSAARLPAGFPIVPAEDPRQDGLNYWIVARYEPDLAARAVQFLRDNNVASFAWPEPDPRFHVVVALPGFERGSLSSPEAKRLDDEIRRLGRVWKAERRGPADFSSSYLKKHEAGR